MTGKTKLSNINMSIVSPHRFYREYECVGKYGYSRASDLNLSSKTLHLSSWKSFQTDRISELILYSHSITCF